jgi:hypothetical protein
MLAQSSSKWLNRRSRPKRFDLLRLHHLRYGDSLLLRMGAWNAAPLKVSLDMNIY